MCRCPKASDIPKLFPEVAEKGISHTGFFDHDIIGLPSSLEVPRCLQNGRVIDLLAPYIQNVIQASNLSSYKAFVVLVP